MITLLDLQKLLPDSKIYNTDNPETIQLESVVTLYQDKPNSITYISEKSYQNDAKQSKANVIITLHGWEAIFTQPVLAVKHVDMALIEVLNIFYPTATPTGKRGQFVVIHPSAQIGENTDIGNFVSIGENTIIGNNCRIADGAKIAHNVRIGDDSSIGPNCVLFNDVRIGKRFISYGNTTIGGDGFRYVDVKSILHRVPQIGGVLIGDDVRVGSNSSIDRGGIDDTMIGDGTKIDNDVQIAHNVKIGKHVIVAGATAIAGSAVVEDFCKISGSCAVADHITLPSGTMIAGGSGLRNTPPKKDLYAGWDWNLTFIEFQKFRANVKHILNLNKLVKKVKDIEEKLGMNAKSNDIT
ncbi:MAG: UDP-3-O-(3-hydroxymyristoyl)glucosamine N-acyltransferase [Leptospiraceae bacterium]|nr:UDP-3-O-(3-hydroxymyristoyl)glucosamine N-acyltransferase [Leptospiraceae bacterium]